MPAAPLIAHTQERIGNPMAALSVHWSHYLIEAAGLGTFMLVAGLAGTALDYPYSSLRLALPDPLIRRALMGLAMGSTASALVYSGWGKRSGAHFNPALTLAFFCAGKIAGWDAIFYIGAQFVGGVIGVLSVQALCGNSFTQPPVSFIVTVPGAHGTAVAFGCEWLISFGLMLLILVTSNHRRWAGLTGLLCGALIALYVTIEAPFSGMSMNPARTVASALPSGIWRAGWIYFVAPTSAMIVATLLYRSTRAARRIQCAKLNHGTDGDCIFVCGYAESRAQGAQTGAIITNVCSDRNHPDE